VLELSSVQFHTRHPQFSADIPLLESGLQRYVFIARIERLEAEKAELASDIRDVYGEMKTFGLDTKVMRKVIALRKQDANERAEQEALLELYLEASDGV